MVGSVIRSSAASRKAFDRITARSESPSKGSWTSDCRGERAASGRGKPLGHDIIKAATSSALAAGATTKPPENRPGAKKKGPPCDKKSARAGDEPRPRPAPRTSRAGGREF